MLRPLARAIAYVTIFSLPITLLPFLHAFISGILWGPWHSQRVHENIDHYLQGHKDVLSDWGVGGDAPTFRQFEDKSNDYHLTRVNANDFLDKLGFVLPKEFTDLETATIEQSADLQYLAVDLKEGKRRAPREQWLYLTNFAHSWFWDDFDLAFDEMVQRAYVDPQLNGSGLHMAVCSGTGAFLCGVWATRAPALVHFVVEDDPIDPAEIEAGLTYVAPLRRLRPVTARIIELPLKDHHSGLPLSTFPSAKEQMLAIMTIPRLYEQWDPYDAVIQTFHRYLEHYTSIWEAKGTFLYNLNLLDDWVRESIAEPIGLGPLTEDFRALVFNAVLLVSGVTWRLVVIAYELIGMFLGRPARALEVLGDSDLDETPEDRFWGDLMGGFGQFVQERLEEERSASAGRGADKPMTTA